MNIISVIVPAFNAAATLGACLDALRSQSLTPAEIIVVDDGSSDETASVALRHRAKLIRMDRNSGPGAARNVGASQAIGDLFAFTDSDCVPPSDWLERISAALCSPDVVAATGGYSGPVTPTFLTHLQHLSLRYRQSGLPESIESAITSNFICRASAFRAAGGFPIYHRRGLPGRPIWGNEDEELGFLLSREGKVRWVPHVGVLHEFRPRLHQYFGQQVFYAERIVMSHFRYRALAATRTNYSRWAGAFHLATICGVLVGLGGLSGCAVIEAVTSPAPLSTQQEGLDLACSLALSILAVSATAAALLPVPTLSFMRRSGSPWTFVVQAHPVLTAISFAWFYGAAAGVLKSLRGFENGYR